MAPVEVVDPRGVIVRVPIDQWWRRHVQYRHPAVAELPLETITGVIAHPDVLIEEVRFTYWAAQPEVIAGGLAVVATVEADGSRCLLTVFPRRPGRQWRGTLLEVAQ